MIGGAISLVSIVFSVLAKIEAERMAEEDRYKTMYEDIFVISRNPDAKRWEDEEFDLWAEDVEELVVWADFEKVRKEVQRQENLLYVNGNKFWIDEELEPEERIRVIPIILKDGEFINEEWGEEFRDRCREVIQEQRKHRHRILKEYDPDWYDEVSNRQKGVAWSKAIA